MNPSKKLLICCVSLTAVFFLSIAIDLACSGEDDPYDYYVSFFHNNVQGEHNYGAFYLSYNYVFSDDEPESEAEINSKEWADYLGRNVKAADVQKAMYLLNRHDDSVMMKDKLLISNKLPDSLKNNTFLIALTSANHKSALQYYLFAKDMEQYANTGFDRWDPKPVDTGALSDGAMTALQNVQNEKDTFIKLRYLYQAERLYHYSGNFKQAMEVYDDHINKYHSNSHIKGWALSLKAGEERHLGDTLKAAYLFSKLFAAYPERRVQAYKNFHYCSRSADSIIKLATNKTEKAYIYAIDGFGEPGMDMSYLQKVYQNDPSSDLVGVLLVREINKLEESYLSPKLNAEQADSYSFYHSSGEDSVRKVNLKHLQLLKDFCVKLSEDRKYAEPGIGYMASAYLAWMEGSHTDEGMALLAKLDHEKLSGKLNDQRQLVKLLLTAQRIEKFNEVNEAQLLPSLKWLDDKVTAQIEAVKPQNTSNVYYYNPSNYDQGKFAASARDFYKLVLAQAYLKQKDTIKAALCILKSETSGGEQASIFGTPVFWQHYLRSGHLNQLIGWKKAPVGTPYFKFLASTLKVIDNNRLYDLLGTDYLREHNYTLAAGALKQIKPTPKGEKTVSYVDSSEVADPFIDQTMDYPKTFLEAGSKGYDKLMFAQAMAGLQNKIKTDPQHASAYYYKMATGLYNASTYGNAYYLISYEWSTYDYGRENRYSYDRDYIKTISAEKYYLKARELSHNAEFKAKCTFMAAKCSQKQITWPENSRYGGPDSTYDLKVRRNPYFTELRNSYARTAFYKDAVSECSYLRDFLAAGKPKVGGNHK